MTDHDSAPSVHGAATPAKVAVLITRAFPDATDAQRAFLRLLADWALNLDRRLARFERTRRR